ncbi:MAG: hypothetical protein GX181_07885 [Synergistaceae bacterium]|nr:hypothetical protein [Synergistota bacterium]NLM71861.1 hypothetical protein [Synergistaceae bacterium]
MKKPLHLSLIVALTLFMVLPGIAEAVTFVAEPVLVAQPAYAGMSFYAYRPYDVPPGWFVTFDGYPIVKNVQGIWVYGTYDGSALAPTTYVVGSINPHALPIVQYAGAAKVSSTQSVPITPLPVPPAPSVQSVAVVPHTITPTYVPEWATQSAFTSIGAWNRLVDRMGILEKPRTPIAWKGDRPKVLYVWTGKSWYQIRAGKESLAIPSELIKGHVYSLMRMVNTNNFTWKDADSAILANQAAVWGYIWMGRITPADF